MPEYDGSEATVILGGQRIENLKSIETPDVDYGREYDRTLGDDDDELLQNTTPNLEGDFTVGATSGSISYLEELLREGSRQTMTIRLPPDHAGEDDKLIGTVLTERSDDDSFENEEGDSSANDRTYSYIAADIQ